MSDAKPHRLNYSEIIAMMLARTPREPVTDIEINRSVTNGRYGFKVSVSLTDPNEAYRKASELAEALAQRFPLPAEPTGVEGYQAEVRKLQKERKVAAISRAKAKQ